MVHIEGVLEEIDGRLAWRLADGRVWPVLAGSDDADDDAAESGEGDAGNATGEAGDQGDEGEGRAADDTGDSSHQIPKARFDQVNTRLRAWSELGATPEEVRAELEELRAERAAAQRAQETAAPTEQDQLIDRYRNLHELAYPEAAEIYREREVLREQIEAAHAAEAKRALVELAKEHDIKTDAETLAQLELSIVGNIHRDPSLHAKYSDPETMREALSEGFNRFRQGFVDPVLMELGAGKLADIKRKREALPSSQSVGDPQPPKGFDEFKPKSAPGTIEYQQELQRHYDRLTDRILDQAMGA